jgi:hypothetical protein
MLPGATVPRSLADLLAVFRPCFTADIPTFVGLVLNECQVAPETPIRQFVICVRLDDFRRP